LNSHAGSSVQLVRESIPLLGHDHSDDVEDDVENKDAEFIYKQNELGVGMRNLDAKSVVYNIFCCFCEFTSTLRGTYAYNLFCFLSHYFSFSVTLVSTVAASFGFYLFGHSTGTIGLMGILAMIADLYLLVYHYKRQTYFPYCASVNLLFIVKGVRVDPGPPPNGVLWFWEKFMIFLQGYIFVVIPSQNVALGLSLYNDPQYERIAGILLLISFIQLITSFLASIYFFVFYVVFIAEILLRSFCYPVCMFRPRTAAAIQETDYYILASSETDPIFYIPYAILYANMF
jgi:hypothetical protein